MKKSTKAALLSALVFPGLGHFYLRKLLLGFLFFAVTAVCLAFFLSAAMDIALQLRAGIESGEIPLNLLHIQATISEEIASNKGHNLDILSGMLLFSWLAATIDAYRLGFLQPTGDD